MASIIEALVLVSGEEPPRIVGLRGRYVGQVFDSQPFGQQWDSCASDQYCGG